MISQVFGNAILYALTHANAAVSSNPLTKPPGTWDTALSLETPYIGLLHTALPTSPVGTINEVTLGNYSRVAFASQFPSAFGTTESTQWVPALREANSIRNNTGSIAFPEATAGYDGTLVGWVIHTASSGTEWLLTRNASSSWSNATINTGDTARFSANSLTITLA